MRDWDWDFYFVFGSKFELGREKASYVYRMSRWDGMGWRRLYRRRRNLPYELALFCVV